jgi:hypothetical protein
MRVYLLCNGKTPERDFHGNVVTYSSKKKAKENQDIFNYGHVIREANIIIGKIIK